MNTNRWIILFFPLALLVLAGCSPSTFGLVEPRVVESDNILPAEALDPGDKKMKEPSSGDVQAGSNSSGLNEIEDAVLPTKESAEMQEPGDYDLTQCGDPFTGTSIRFSTRGWETNFCQHSVPYDEFLSGGPPRDGIPPIDDPRFESVDSAGAWLDGREPVIALDIAGDVRAYPLQILMWHEIVNDTVGGVPVVVTFCPLCNTALVFQRPLVAGEPLTFGTSGNLRNSDLVMWDRQTESWWQQFTGEAIVGDLTGTRLDFLPTAILSWSDFKVTYPDSQVLSQDTGYIRNYGANPYAGYDDVDQFPFLFDGPLDDRLLPMTRVLGVDLDGQTAAYPLDRLAAEAVINDALGDIPVAVFWKAGTASAVDALTISAGRDVGSTGVFLRQVRDQILTFTPGLDGTFVDTETGSTWDILGTAVDGPLTGTRLTPISHHDTFWFAWAAFVPDLELRE